MPSYDVFYMHRDFFRDGIMGHKWCEEKGKLPDPKALLKTHRFVKQLEANDLGDVFMQMQGEVWSPNGEARELIRRQDLDHTSMSVGDIVINETGTCWMVDRYGFKPLN